MQIEDLKIWIDLCDTKSFSKCAEKNFLSQPAVSQKIKALEEKYGVPLILRSRKRIELTQAGKILYEESREIIGIYQNLSSKVKSFSGVIHGTIKIATIYSIGLYELNDIIRNFLNKYPKIHIEIEFSQNSKIYQNILDESIDVGFVAYPQEHPCAEIIPFKKEKLVLVVNPKHHLAKQKAIDINKLNNCEFISFEDDIPTGEAIKSIFRKHNIKVKTKMKFENIELIKRAVEINAGVTILPYVTVEKEIRHRLLKGILFTDSGFLRPVGIVLKRTRPPSPAMQKFIEETLKS